MANNKIQVKRTSTSGRTPNTTNSGNAQYIAAGELALNMADGILYTSNGSVLLPVGANNVDVNVSNTLTVKAVSANGGNGSSGQVLTSNGTATYWSTVSATINTDAQYNWTNIHTFSENVSIGKITFDVTSSGSLTSINTNGVYYAFFTNPSAGVSGEFDIDHNSFGIMNYSTNASKGIAQIYMQPNTTSSTTQKIQAEARSGYTLVDSGGELQFGSYLPDPSFIIGNNAISIRRALYANGAAGSSGDVLYSNGTSIYWAASSGGVNTDAQYTWTNTQTFANAVFINNDKPLRFKTVNTSAYAYFVQQSDDNFVFYTTNTSYGARPVFNIYANSDNGEFGFGVPVRFNSNVTVLVANGSAGATNQVLTSNGSTVYWSSPGAASVNTSAQYTWSNTHTFQANVSFTGNNISLVTNTGSIHFAGSGDTNWRIGRSTGSTTKFYYTNNSLDIIVADSNLEGFVIGKPGGNTYLETGYAGTFTKNPIYVGNATVNVTINSTSFTGSANNASYLGGTAAASFVQNTDSRTLSGNLVISGTYFNPSANTILLGNSTQRWVISGNSGDFSSTVNAVTSVNSALLTVGTAFIANTTGAYHTGTINAASITTTGITVNAIGVYPTSNTSGQNLGTDTRRFDAFLDVVDVTGTITSNTGGNAVVFSNQTSQWIYFAAGGAGAPTNTNRSAGTKVVIWPSLGSATVDYAIGTDNNVLWYSVGAVTASHVWYANTTSIMTSNQLGLYHGGTVNAASHTVGTTAVVNSTAIYFGTINATSNGITANATTINIGNSSVNSSINSTAFTGSSNNSSYLGGVAAASYVNTSGNYTLGGNLSLTAGANSIALTNGTSNWIYWADAGATAPTFTTRSAGTKLVLYPALSGVQADYAMGIEPATLWSSVPVASDSFGFKWYGGTTQAASLTGAGNLTLAGNVTVNGVIANGSGGTSGQVLTANGTGVYWSTVSSGSVNVDAQYTWTNTQSFTNVITFSNNIIVNGIQANGSYGTSGQVLTSNGSDTYWSTSAGGTPGVGTGAGSDDTFFINGQFVNTDYTTSATKNYMSAGPITLNANVTITSGSRWAIV